VIQIAHDPDQQDVVLQGSSRLPDALPVLPLKETVAFPNTMTPLAVGQERSVQLVNDALTSDRMVVMVASKDAEIDLPGPDDVYRVGVVGVIARMLKMPDGTLRILVNGGQRVRIEDFVRSEPYLVARIREEPDVVEESAELEALTRHVQNTFSSIIEGVPYLPEELQIAIANMDDPATLAHMIAGSLRIPVEVKQELLEEVDVAKRLRRLSELLAHELEVMELGSKIQSQVQSEMDQQQREYFLRQQMKAIQDELGEVDETQAEINDLREKMEEAELPEDVKQQAERELSRLEKLPTAAAEHGVIRTYLEWIISLPWSKSTEDNLDLEHAREVLDEDHYDIENVKDRILEHLAVRKLKPDSRGSILAFVGPPGVGKTSLGKSIARALERKFERISVGGVRDEAEIRGHRRTYIGAMPGTIIRALRDAESNNPVFMIDEIDKMGADFRGDPASAMLEVLDPEQNQSFRDHYLDLPFDLSRVFFITTANVLEAIPGPLRDRMEVIQLAGYTAEEKKEIARRYLLPRQIERNGLRPSQIEIKDEVIDVLIEEYTREAGVRNLERELGSLCRKVAREFAEEKAKRKVTVNAARARQMLGKRKFFSETKRRTSEPGVATGLAWTPVGGEVLFVEATDFPGSGKLNITGQLGDVMKESALAALSWVRAHAKELNPELPDDYFQTHDRHVHVPAGAIPKDGPSAGVAMATALASLISGRAVRDDTAMTGELTLTGQVLPIGGLKEKALAAQDAEIKRVIAPRLNEQDIDEIPEHLRKEIEFEFVERIEDGLAEALLPGPTEDGASRRRPPSTRTGTRRRDEATVNGSRRARTPARSRAKGRPK
jgi:ATP-dependent Lon protease